MKTLSLLLLGFVALFPLTMLQGQEIDPETARKYIEELSQAVDFEDDRLVENLRLLEVNSKHLFPLWADLVRTSDNDRLIQITMSTARAAPPEKAKELAGLAETLLTKRDAAKFPLAVESAIKTMGAVGGAESQELIQRFASHPNPAIRLAAQKTLESLLNRQPPSAIQVPAVKLPPVKPPLSTTKNPEAAISPTPSEEPTSSAPELVATSTPTIVHETKSAPSGFPIVPVVLGGVLIVGIVLYLLRRKSK